MVAGFQDEIDSDEEMEQSIKPAVSHDVDLSSDDDVTPVTISTVAKDIELSSDEDTNSVPVVTQDVEISSDDENPVEIKLIESRPSKNDISVMENNITVNTSILPVGKTSLSQRDSVTSNSSVEDSRTSSEEKEKVVQKHATNSNNSSNQTEVHRKTSRHSVEEAVESQVAAANESSDEDESTNQVTVIADVDVEEEEIKPANQEGFDSWLDELESKVKIYNSSVSRFRDLIITYLVCDKEF